MAIVIVVAAWVSGTVVTVKLCCPHLSISEACQISIVSQSWLKSVYCPVGGGEGLEMSLPLRERGYLPDFERKLWISTKSILTRDRLIYFLPRYIYDPLMIMKVEDGILSDMPGHFLVIISIITHEVPLSKYILQSMVLNNTVSGGLAVCNCLCGDFNPCSLCCTACALTSWLTATMSPHIGHHKQLSSCSLVLYSLPHWVGRLGLCKPILHLCRLWYLVFQPINENWLINWWPLYYRVMAIQVIAGTHSQAHVL